MSTLIDKICYDINKRANEKLANAAFESALEGGIMGAGSSIVSQFTDPEEDKNKEKKSLFKAIAFSGLLGALGGAVAAYKIK